jgi:hypothetical protein
MLKAGIVGLPNIGKSTLFNALTRSQVPSENYPFCTIDPSVGVVSVPDERLDKLSEFSKSKKTIPAACEFVDIAGLVKGAAEGEGLGNKFLSNIGEVDMIVEVVRIFEDSNIAHVHGEIDPISDIETINLELVLKDRELCAKRLSFLERGIKTGDKNAILEKEVLTRVNGVLDNGKLATDANLNDEDLELLKEVNLLTLKPILYALNKKAGGTNLDELEDGRYAKLVEFFDKLGALYVLIDVNIEGELQELQVEDREQYRKELGVSSDGIQNLITKTYELLGLITFFTTGEDETRGWTIRAGSTAPVAGGAIHTDFTEQFIRAEVIEWKKLLDSGTYSNARDKGLIRTEGKEYEVQDGDVIEFKI